MALTEQQRANLTARRDAATARIETDRQTVRMLNRILDGDFETAEELAAIRTKLQAIKGPEIVASK